MQYLDVYIQALNPFELLTGNKDVDNAGNLFQEALKSSFSSLGESLGVRKDFIVDRKEINEKFGLPANKADYLKFLKGVLVDEGMKKFFKNLVLEELNPWV